MPDVSDMELVGQFVCQHSEAAFAELVRRHINLVYSVALRFTGNSEDAQDVAQAVFITFAKKAAGLRQRALLSSWLYETTRLTAAGYLRARSRRQAREQEAYMQSTLNESDAASIWPQLAPYLEAAMSRLGKHDRALLALRFYENKSGAEAASLLGIREEAAHKRTARALARLRRFFHQRGISATASALATALSANAVQAAPAGLATSISSAALSGTAVTTAAALAATKAIAMTTLQKTIIATALLAAAGAGIYEAKQAANARAETRRLRQEQAPLSEQLRQLQTNNERLSNQVAQTKDAQGLSQAQRNELLRLRAKSTLAQTDSRELARLRSTLAQQTGKMPDFARNAFTAAAQKAIQEREFARLSRMKEMLNLTEDQAQAIKNIMTNNIQRQSQMSLDLFMGKLTREQALAESRALADQEPQVKALLTPEQLAAYPEYQQAETRAAADASATSAARGIANKFNLPKDQQEQLRALFYAMNLKEATGAHSPQAMAEARKSGNLAELARMDVELKKARLEERLKILGGFLSPQQLTAYRQEETDRINDAMKMFAPQEPAGAAN